jgi:apolipoprotein N-acyltransferase
MTRTKGLALAFYLAAAVAGVAIGVAADRMFRPAIATRATVRMMRDRFANDLKLTAAQRAAVVVPIRPQLDSVRADARGKISALLTPEQLRVYEQMQRDQKARTQEKK